MAKAEMQLRVASTRRGLMHICNAAFLPGRPTLAFPALKMVVFVGPMVQQKKLRALGWKVASISAHRVSTDADKELAKAFKRAK